MFVHARILAALIFAGSWLAAAAAALPASASDTQRWQSISANDTKVGHARITRRVTTKAIVETEIIDIRLGKAGRRLRYHIVLESDSSLDGSLRRVLREVDAPEGHSRVEMHVRGDDVEITHGDGKMKTSQLLDGAAQGLESEEVAREWLAAIGRGDMRAPFRYRTWDPVKLGAVDVELVAMPSEDGTNVERRVTSARGTSGSRLGADAAGNIVRESMSVGSFDLHRVEATPQQAQAPNQPFDHVAPLLQKSPYRIPSRDMRAKIRYRFDNHGVQVDLPVGAGQRSWTEGGHTWIQVCASCPSDPIELPAEERARALAATPWLETADTKIALNARRRTSQGEPPAARMRKLTTFVRGYMGTRIDMLGYGTAAETIRTRRGDCTEYAVLLAALGRAAGVPTRIAIGRVYARRFEGRSHVFVPHAWVQAWTGSGWESFDAAIGTFDSTHLAFRVSYDGDPLTHFTGIQLSSDLTMDAAARVVPRAAATN